MYVVSSFNPSNTAAQGKLKLESCWGWIKLFRFICRFWNLNDFITLIIDQIKVYCLQQIHHWTTNVFMIVSLNFSNVIYLFNVDMQIPCVSQSDCAHLYNLFLSAPGKNMQHLQMTLFNNLAICWPVRRLSIKRGIRVWNGVKGVERVALTRRWTKSIDTDLLLELQHFT